jgi:diguanylate cyclase (GGDEF)-like protein
MAVAVRQDIVRSANERFDASAIDLARKVENRFDDYIAVLTGLRARFNTPGTISREDFRNYVAGLDLASNYPGFQAITYAPYIAGADRQHFEEQVRRDPILAPAIASKFAIAPPGEREGYYPILYVEPFAGNEKALGMDLAAMPNRGKALEQARDTGALISSGRKIRIAGRDAEIGLAMRLPVYRAHMPLDTVEQRRAAYVGSVGSGFSVSRMMRDVVVGQARTLRFRLFDAGASSRAVGSRVESRFVAAAAAIGDSQLLFDSASSSDPAGPAGASPRPTGSDIATARAERTLCFEFGGHSWVIHVAEDESDLIGRLDRAIPWLIALAGVAISALLAGIVYSLITSRRRALVLATSMTAHLRASECQLEQAQRLATLGNWILDIPSGTIDCSEEASRILGFEPGPIDVQMLLSHVDAHDRTNVAEHMTAAMSDGRRRDFEHALHLPDGTERWVHVVLQSSTDDGLPRLHGTVRDDTPRRRAALRMKLEHDIARMLVGDGDSEAVFSDALQAACTSLRWECGALWFAHEDGVARCLATWHAGDNQALRQFVDISRSLQYRRDEGSLGRAWATGEAVHVEGLAERRDFTRDALAGQAGLTAGLIIPMVVADASMALEVFGRATSALDAEALQSLRVVALLLAQYAQRKRAEHGLRFVASHDSLTGLFNRAALQRELKRAIRRANRDRRRFAVLFIDLDRFKHINDSLGHGVGDRLLEVCAKRLQSVLRAGDSVARFGGDEFVLVLENLSGVGDATALADRAIATVAQPFMIEEHELHITASIGVSVYPEDGTDPETLLKNADTAMYRAKDRGRGTHRFYAAQMNAQAGERLMLESGLRRAVERQELELHYQPKPIFDTSSQQVVCKSLIRMVAGSIFANL